MLKQKLISIKPSPSPHLTYSPMTLLLASFTQQYKSQIIQNKSLRLITKADRRTTNRQIHRTLKIPPVIVKNYLALNKIKSRLDSDRLYQNMKTKNRQRPQRLIDKFPTSDSITRPNEIYSQTES